MRKTFILILVLSLVLLCAPKGFCASEEEIQTLKLQVYELMKRIEQLEQAQIKQKEDFTKQKEEIGKKVEASRVDLANTLSKLKIKGRWAAGFFDSDKAGSYPSGSFEAPDAKIQFAFQPDEVNTITLRFNVNNATAQSPLMDYLFLQSKDFLPQLKNTPFSLNARLGRFKLGFGEETWSDNPIESVLPSNSAAKAGATDEGIELAGKIKLDKIKMGTYTLKPLGWVLSVSNGSTGVGSDTSTAKAFMGKLYYTPIDPLYLSTSYYNSGNLKTTGSEFSIDGLSTITTGGTSWRREVWELDARYDFGKGKKPLDPPAYSDSKAIVRVSYGAFHDAVTAARERAGNFGFVEGTYSWTKKFYTAGRYSFVNLEGDTTASLNSVTANKHCRYSLGLGYRWSENTILKLGYDWNTESGSGVTEAENNLLSAIVSTQF